MFAVVQADGKSVETVEGLTDTVNGTMLALAAGAFQMSITACNAALARRAC